MKKTVIMITLLVIIALGILASPKTSKASEPFIGEIILFAGNFAPRNFAFCNGQLLQISQNTALFSLLGTTYGGDGRTTFGLPNLQSFRVPISAGRGPGLTTRILGQAGGATTATLTLNMLPPHNHLAIAETGFGADNPSPLGNTWTIKGTDEIYGVPGTTVQMGNDILAYAGGGQAHNNMQPYITVNYCIALQGIYPDRP